ncbi:MAG: hypothetical protein OEM15_07015 [Myxococcales bacterium]|nr:hypothetical protein [Myxococcales bacterium]MDH3483299.1 hypothetical protein [Myxococcales bacterium]
MKPLTRYWFGDVALARPYSLVRFVLTMLAFDSWLNLMPHGAKYGVGGFNVAHFPVFGDFIPSAPFYLGVLAFTSVLALSQALYRPHRIALALVAMGYTLGWTCSLLDSVAYHYLVSLYLGCFVFFPMLSARAAFSRSDRAPRGSAWAYVLFCVTTAIVYFYVAAWDAADGEPYWLPMVCSGAYLVASMQDRSDSTAVLVTMPFLGVAPIAFHWLTPTESWFPIYMIGIAVLVFAPARWIHVAGRTLTFPARNWLQDQSEVGIDERASQVFYASLAGLVTAPVVSMFVDLPGVKTGCALTAIAMLFVIGRQLYLTPKRRPLWRVVSLFGGCLALWITMATSTARFDYYRSGAIDADLRGDHDAAALMREKAERYRR